MKTRHACITDRTPEDLANCFLDWFNNYLTASAFAEAYGVKPWEAVLIINAGREAHEARVRA